MSDRARTPEQKRAVMERILAVWEKTPQLRLGQLIINSMSGLDGAHTERKTFYVEDEALAKRIELLNTEL